MRLPPARRGWIVAAQGTAQTIGWASSFYVPAVLALPMAASFGLSPVWVFGAALAAWGLHAIWLTAGIGVLATLALLAIRRG